MYAARGALRLIAMVTVVALLALSLLLTGWIPYRRAGVHHAGLQASFVGGLLLRILGIPVQWDQPERFQAHRGFIFPNHTSFVDALIMASITPVRFLAKAEIARWPAVGTIGRSIGVIFVQRDDKASRTAARNALAHVAQFPPIVLFPEGGILSPDRLHPFRYGAFEIAVQGGFSILPCLITYNEPYAVFWGDESIWSAAWRMLTRRTPIVARVTPLRVIHPEPDDDPQQLAIQTHGAMDALRRSLGGADDVILPGL